MDWQPIEYGRFQTKGRLGTYIVYPTSEGGWVASFLGNDARDWKIIEKSDCVENAKWIAENYDGYRSGG